MLNLKKLNLLGYTPETQVWVVQNGGGKESLNTAAWLQAHRKFFDHSLFCGQTYYTLAAGRITKFKAYAESKGITVEQGGFL